MMQTDLKLSLTGFPPMSARNCTQELFPISTGNFYRDINGKLVFIPSSKEAKYKTVITCKDVNPPAFGCVCIGTEVQVSCIQYIWQYVKENLKIRTSRPPVENSVIVVDANNEPVNFFIDKNNNVVINGDSKKQYYVGFRPVLNMRILDFSISTDEWEMISRWKLVMEEI